MNRLLKGDHLFGSWVPSDADRQDALPRSEVRRRGDTLLCADPFETPTLGPSIDEMLSPRTSLDLDDWKGVQGDDDDDITVVKGSLSALSLGTERRTEVGCETHQYQRETESDE